MHPLNHYRLTLFGFSALWIDYFHFAKETVFYVSLLKGLEQFIQQHGYLGVDTLAFLSSFGLETIFIKTNTFSISFIIHYYLRRFSRIYSVYLPFTLVKTIFHKNFIRSFIRLLCFIQILLKACIVIIGLYLLFYVITYLHRFIGKYSFAGTIKRIVQSSSSFSFFRCR